MEIKNASTISKPLHSDEILKFLPHRFPMILVDRVLEINVAGDPTSLADISDKTGTTVRAHKLISFSDPLFQGHFPNRPIFPGVMTLETLAQTACFSMYLNIANNDFSHSIQVALLGFDGVRFRSPIVPGDVLELRTKALKIRRSIMSFETSAHVDGKLVCEAEILAHLEYKKKD